MSKGDIVISVRHKFVERIVAGKKGAELRRRAPRIQPGCKVWIYTKAPEAVISICVTVDRIVAGSPKEIWQSHRSDLGVSRDQGGQLSRLMAPALRKKMRPSPVIRGIEHPAGNIFIDRIAKQTHRGSPPSKRDA